MIIGGGIQGVCTALNLAERGMNVALCDKGAIAGEQSGRAYSQLICGELDDPVVPLVLRSKQLWRGMNKRINTDTSWRIRGGAQHHQSATNLTRQEVSGDALNLVQDYFLNQDFQQRKLKVDSQTLPGLQTLGQRRHHTVDAYQGNAAQDERSHTWERVHPRRPAEPMPFTASSTSRVNPQVHIALVRYKT